MSLMTNTNRKIAKLDRLYRTALRIEIRAVDALPERAPPAMTERCWALAAKTNAAMRALQSAHRVAAFAAA